MKKTRKQSFIEKYGETEGLARLSYIAKVAVQARWKSYYKSR